MVDGLHILTQNRTKKPLAIALSREEVEGEEVERRGGGVRETMGQSNQCTI
jgi:hypothetical protein